MTQPTKWSAPLGSGADVQELPDDDLRYASFSKIFPQITQVPLSAGGVAPRRIDFNSLFKLLADNIYYYQNGGVFEYSDTSDYEKGALVRYNDKIYLCIQTNGADSTVAAPTDSTYWSQIPTYADLSDWVPTGVILPFGGSTIPNGYLLCNGAEISRVDFSELFEIIGTTYGSGDESTTFALPDLRSRYIQGVGTNALGTYLSDGLPNITGILNDDYIGKSVYSSGAFNFVWGGEMVGYGGTGGYGVLSLDASRSNNIYGNSSYVTPKSLVLNYIIKY